MCYSEKSVRDIYNCKALLTGALGLIITLGGSAPCRLGVPGAPALGDPIALNRSGETLLWPGFNALIDPDCGCKAGLDDAFTPAPSFAGRGLFRGSVKVVVEEDGVATGD